MPAKAPVLMATAGGLLMLATGCTIGPHYKTPHPALPSSYSELNVVPETNQISRVTAGGEALERWWAAFADPELDALIHRALQGNRDLRLALSRVRQAKAQRRVVASGLFPEVDVTGGYIRSRGSKNVEIPLSGLGGGGGSGGSASGGASSHPMAIRAKSSPGDPPAAGTSSTASAPDPAAPLGPFGKGGLPGVTTALYQAGFDASWELDVFGGTRRAIEAANADTAAALEDHRSVLVTLLAEVANTYVQLRTSQQRLAIARENLASQRAALAIIQAKFNSGLATDLDVAQESAQVASTAATLPALQSAQRQALHTLGFLIGGNPDALAPELTPMGPMPALPPEVPLGLPSDLLRRRPDIREAERRLAAATARIGVARADFFPRFNLTGAFGFDSSQPKHLFDWQSRYFAINPGVSWPVLDWGRIRGNVNVQNELEEQAWIGYEDALRRALKEVEDALESFQNEQARRAALAEAVDQSRKAVNLAQQRYRNGLVDFLTVLDSQRELFAAQDSLAQSDSAIRTNLIALYKALGGGWESTADNPSAVGLHQ